MWLRRSLLRSRSRALAAGGYATHVSVDACRLRQHLCFALEGLGIVHHDGCHRKRLAAKGRVALDHAGAVAQARCYVPSQSWASCQRLLCVRVGDSGQIAAEPKDELAVEATLGLELQSWPATGLLGFPSKLFFTSTLCGVCPKARAAPSLAQYCYALFDNETGPVLSQRLRDVRSGHIA